MTSSWTMELVYIHFVILVYLKTLPRHVHFSRKKKRWQRNCDWIEYKFDTSKITFHAVCGIRDVVLCYPRCWSVEFLMQIAGSGSSIACSIDIHCIDHRVVLLTCTTNALLMPGLWYEFNDTEHDRKACQRCNDKKLCLLFTPLCWHQWCHQDGRNVLYQKGFVTAPVNNFDFIASQNLQFTRWSSWKAV